ncbi:MAG: flagellar hook-length control protein FliK [Oscillospiraceae bacterium]|nr:flagellar hook-length control protein FliK [Oscillospiraceae bacterium]
MDGISFDMMAGLKQALVASTALNPSSGAGVKIGSATFGEVMRQAANDSVPTAKAVVSSGSAGVSKSEVDSVVYGLPQTKKLTEEEAGALVDGFIAKWLELTNSEQDFDSIKLVINTASDDDETYGLICRIFAEKAALSGNELLMGLNPEDVVVDFGKAVEADEESDEKDQTLIDSFIKTLREHYDERVEKSNEYKSLENVISMSQAALWATPSNAPEKPVIYIPEYADPSKLSPDVLRSFSSFLNGIPEEEEFENRTIVPPPKEDAFVKLIEVKASGGADGDVNFNAGGLSAPLKINDATAQISALKTGSDGLNTGFVPGVDGAVFQTASGNYAEVNQTAAGQTNALDSYHANLVERQLTERLTPAVISTGSNGVSEMVIVLKPEELGEIAVKIISEKGKVSITMAAQHHAVNSAVNDRASDLASGLSRQGIDVKSIDVIDPSDAAAQMGLDFTNQGFNRRDTSEAGDGETNRSKEGMNIDGVLIDEELDNEAELHESILTKEAKLWARA